jgi:hypothetical protein
MELDGLWIALTRNSAQTSERAGDPRLRGRTYFVPFARVFDEIVAMVRGRSGWRLIRADEGGGLIHAEAASRLFRLVADVRFKIKLDENALTRLDIWSASRAGKADLGANARRIARFCRELDRRLGVRS